MCVFCNQHSISGKQTFRRESVKEEIEAALSTIPSDREVEIAYFGGSFTGIERGLMLYLLDVAKGYVERPEDGRARVSGIRLSTRPDYIDAEIMEILSHYPVRTVELGLQSMDDEVLLLSNRGHDAKQAEAACRMIKKAGYSLIGQMMIGLPGSTLEKELETARKICELGADGARIYPTVTFYDTELANMAERGEYEMLGADDAVLRSKEVLKVFQSRGVEVIRIGLCASDNLGDLEKVKGGANHPALGELVLGELYFDRMCELIEELLRKRGQNPCLSHASLAFTVPKGELSKAIGQKGRNRERILEAYKPKQLIIRENNVSELELTLTE